MHRRIEIDCALSSINAESGARCAVRSAGQEWYADADVDTAAAIVAPTNITTRQRLMIALLFYE